MFVLPFKLNMIVCANTISLLGIKRFLENSAGPQHRECHAQICTKSVQFPLSPTTKVINIYHKTAMCKLTGVSN